MTTYPRFRVSALCVLLLMVALPAAAQDHLRPTADAVRVVGSEDLGFEAAHPAWSPDGAQIAFTRPGYDGIWVVSPDGQQVRQITDEASAGFGFSWSPDAEEILARVSRVDGIRGLHAVKVFAIATSESRQLTEYRSRMPALPQWTVDGSAIILPLPAGAEVLEAVESADADAPLFVGDDRGLAAVYHRNESTRTERVLSDIRVLNAVASPDGSRIVFEEIGGDLHVVNADGTELISIGSGHRPTWSPDGAWIAFMRTEDNGKNFTSSDIYAARADGSEVVPLTQTTDRLEMNPSWSPDGSHIAYDDLQSGAIFILPVAW